MNYLADPGGRFSSDTHRRVLGNLSYPDDNYGWSTQALVQRMLPDLGTNISNVDEMEQVLSELEDEGHAQRIQTPQGDVWKMTQGGLDVLTGPIANEPPEGAAVQGPAMIGTGAATQLGPTPTNGNNGAPPAEQAQADQPTTGETGAGSNPS